MVFTNFISFLYLLVIQTLDYTQPFMTWRTIKHVFFNTAAFFCRKIFAEFAAGKKQDVHPTYTSLDTFIVPAALYIC
ncbi:MAG: hypothetical protein CL578_09715 [Alteromonadaceae bacterium]|nr:hypothetical protein [Alteromonadaceae bacterium]